MNASARGGAFAHLSGHRIILVRGADASGWLHDLVTCDVASLRPGDARRSLLLSPTGHIRADFTVARDDSGFLLLQASDQPASVGALLAPYVLSSAVAIADRTQDRALFALPGMEAGVALPPVANGTRLAPSVLGPGVDLLVARADVEATRRALLGSGRFEATGDDVESWRIARGDPRMGPDFGPDALPAEVGLERTIDLTKGCFLGQESVARVRNLGRPPWVLRHVRTTGALRVGDVVMDEEARAGTVTSAVPGPVGTVAIVRVRRTSASRGLTSQTGEAINTVGSSG